MRSAGAALLVLFLVNTLNFFDRMALSAVVEPLRREWALGDAQIGWLGTAFTLLYATVGLPLGRLADTWRRTALLAAGVLLWSLMTFLSGFATGFLMLFTARMLVGVGEAVCAPVATSLIGDLFPSARRGRANAVFMLGLPVGIGLSYAVSGAVAQAWGWRATFMVAGAPGLLLVLLCLALREPQRGAVDEASAARPVAASSAFALLLRTPTFVWIVLSGALHNFNMYALSTFLPAFLTRHHGLTVREAGLVSGLVFGVGGGLGMMAGGLLGDRLAARDPAGRMRAALYCLAASVPFLIVLLAQPRGAMARVLPLLAGSALLLYAYYAPVYATLQDIVAPASRGTAMAAYFFAMYLLGAALGPVGTGLLSDWLAGRAALRLGLPPGAEAARAAGLHQALLVVPALGLLLALVLFMAARTVAADRQALSARMRADAA